MSALEKLKAGISAGDWSIVVEGYAELTGEALPVPDTPLATRSRVHQLVAELAEELQLTPARPEPEATAEVPGEQQEGQGPRPGTEPDDEPDDEDGDEENRVEAVAAAGESGKQTIYGNTQEFVTAEGDPPSQRIAKNRTRASRTRKRHRGKPKVHKQVCTQCEQEFEVPVRAPKDVGQQCPRCLAGASRERA